MNLHQVATTYPARPRPIPKGTYRCWDRTHAHGSRLTAWLCRLRTYFIGYE